MQVQVIEQIAQHGLAAACNYAAALVHGGDPVAHAARTVQPVDGMAAQAAAENAVRPYTALRTAAVLPLGQDRVDDEVAHVGG